MIYTVSPPGLYLGDNVGKWQLLDGSNLWWMIDRDYTSNEFNLDKNIMEQKGMVFEYRKRSKRPILMIYRP